MNSMIAGIKSGAFTAAIIVLTVILLLMAIIHMNSVLGRKYEIALLKANGLTRRELFKLIMAESLRYVFWVSLASGFISMVLINAVNFGFNETLVKAGPNVLPSTSWWLSSLVFYPHFVITINKYRPDTILAIRNTEEKKTHRPFGLYFNILHQFKDSINRTKKKMKVNPVLLRLRHLHSCQSSFYGSILPYGHFPAWQWGA